MLSEEECRALGLERHSPITPQVIEQWNRLHPGTYRLLWLDSVEVSDPVSEWPRPLGVGSGQTDNPHYYCEGGLRPSNQYCVFHYVLAGEAAFGYAGREYRLRPGQGFLFEAADPQVAYWFPHDAKTPWRFMWISFTGVIAHQVTRDLISRYGSAYDVPAEHPMIRRLCAFERNGFFVTDTHPVDGIQLVMEVLLGLASAGRLTEGRDASGELTRQAIRLINAQIERPLGVGELADRLEVTREHLARVFRQRLDMSPQEFILHQKLRLACCLLKETHLSSKQIAARLGFDAAPTFSRAFRRVFGMPPGEFRVSGTVPLR